MTTFCRFVQFEDDDQALFFSVRDAIPEREDGILGELPNGIQVHSDFSFDDDDEGFWLIADSRRLLNDIERHNALAAVA